MKLIVGLGNPGKEYEKTRHNAGFLAIERFRQDSESGEWKFEHKFNAEIAEGKIDDERVMLARPHTYMNKSGEAVRALARFYKIKPNDVWVLHDDLDLPMGTLRIKMGGSAAGHKGVESVMRALGGASVRFRIGTAPARKRKESAEKFVLGKFSATDMKKIAVVAARISQAITCAANDGLPKAMSLYSR
ncbi:aminoacyl-tRNA hydrolase [Candidatus Uhrbacteria bacterium]|nr:aminoacyl-tRNA hydrolase [Candidatus Uhrbacteria bacterium]